MHNSCLQQGSASFCERTTKCSLNMKTPRKSNTALLASAKAGVLETTDCARNLVALRHRRSAFFPLQVHSQHTGLTLNFTQLDLVIQSARTCEKEPCGEIRAIDAPVDDCGTSVDALCAKRFRQLSVAPASSDHRLLQELARLRAPDSCCYRLARKSAWPRQRPRCASRCTCCVIPPMAGWGWAS